MFYRELTKAKPSHRMICVAAAIPLIVLVIAGLHRGFAENSAEALLRVARGSEARLALSDANGVPASIVLRGALAATSDLDAIDVTPFAIDLHEVTNAQYAACVKAKKCEKPGALEDYNDPTKGDWPVVEITAADADAFCEWIGRRLPTAVEWEFAARGSGIGTTWPWGDQALDRTRANLHFLATDDQNGSSQDSVVPDTSLDDAGTSEPPGSGGLGSVEDNEAGKTPDGVSHLIGNVFEWTSTSPELCNDYADCATPWTRAAKGVRLVLIRGGSFMTPAWDAMPADEIGPTASALPVPVDIDDVDIGFRCARTLTDKETTT